MKISDCLGIGEVVPYRAFEDNNIAFVAEDFFKYFKDFRNDCDLLRLNFFNNPELSDEDYFFHALPNKDFSGNKKYVLPFFSKTIIALPDIFIEEKKLRITNKLFSEQTVIL